MISKHCHKSARFKNRAGCTSRKDVFTLVKYQLRPAADPQILWNDFQNESPEGITDEVMALARPDLTYKGYHMVLAFAPGEMAQCEPHLDHILLDFQKRFKVYRMMWVRHGDHVHGFIFAENERGKKLRLETEVDGEILPVAPSLRRFSEDWEDALSLQKTGRDRSRGMNLPQDALEMALREHQSGKSLSPVPAKLMLRAQVERLVKTSGSVAELTANAAADGVEVRITQHANGVGISFSNGTTSLRGRDAGFTFQQLTDLYHENPRTARDQPTQRVAAGDRSPNRRTPRTRAEGADTNPPRDADAPAGGQGREHEICRGMEAALRALTGIKSSDGLLAVLQFLTTSFVEIASAADTRRRRPSPNRNQIPL